MGSTMSSPIGSEFGRHRAEDRAPAITVPRDASRTRFISRAKGYHGMGWAASVSGIFRHRRILAPAPGGDHLPAHP